MILADRAEQFASVLPEVKFLILSHDYDLIAIHDRANVCDGLIFWMMIVIE